MKLRIKGSSIRLRLTKSEVNALALENSIEEHINFGINKLYYALEKSTDLEMSAAYKDNKIIVRIPAKLIEGWAKNDQVGFSEQIQLTETSTLFLLVEKDFVCLDETTEDQSDNYSNPKLNC